MAVIHLRTFARYRDLLGFDEKVMDPAPTSLEELLKRNEFETLPSEALLAVNRRLVPRDTQLSDGDEVAFFPPVSGG